MLKKRFWHFHSVELETYPNAWWASLHRSCVLNFHKNYNKHKVKAEGDDRDKGDTPRESVIRKTYTDNRCVCLKVLLVAKQLQTQNSCPCVSDECSRSCISHGVFIRGLKPAKGRVWSKSVLYVLTDRPVKPKWKHFSIEKILSIR